MNIMFLWGNHIAKSLEAWLCEQGNHVVSCDGLVTAEKIKQHQIELIISYTYRYILKKEVIDSVNGNVVNLHISYLPWNRGTSPNQWSWIDKTPKGVTIHYINENIDSGDIIAQEIVEMDETISLKESYALLNDRIVSLFQKIYPLYPFWEQMRKKAQGAGSYHTAKEFEVYDSLIGGNYDLSVKEFLEKIEKIH